MQQSTLAVGLAKIERKLPELTARVMAARSNGRDIGGEVSHDADVAELGRFVVTLRGQGGAQLRDCSVRAAP